MKQTIEFVKTTVVGGLVVILPLAAAMVITIKLLGAIEGPSNRLPRAYLQRHGQAPS
jgi:uncharacterized membrane protein